MKRFRKTVPPLPVEPARRAGYRDNMGRIMRFALRHAANKNLTQVAASLTFTTVLGIVPLLAVILSLFTAFPLFDEFRIALEDFLADSLMPPAVSSNVMSYLNQFAAKASGLTAIGGMALIVTSIMLLRTIDEAFNTIWQVRRQRPIRHRILVYWAILSIGPVLIGASLWASSIMAQYSADYMGKLPLGLGVALTLAPLAASTAGFTALFTLVPNCRVNWKDALAGGFLTALALFIMRQGFTIYLAHFPSYTIIYGAFATLPIFLLWLYLSWIAVLSGATLAAILPAIRQRMWDRTHYAGEAFVDAVRVLAALWRPAVEHIAGHTLDELATTAQLPVDRLREALRCLCDLGYAVNSEGVDQEIWVFAEDRRHAGLGRLADALLLDISQPGLAAVPGLLTVLAQVHAGQDARLESLFEHAETLSEIGHLGQNEETASRSAATTEAHHAKSQ